MKHPVLFEVPKDSINRKDRLHAFMTKNGILTHSQPSKYCDKSEGYLKWMAVHVPTLKASSYIPSYCNDFSSIPVIMSQVCRLLEESDLYRYGNTEAEAVESICNRVGIKFNP